MAVGGVCARHGVHSWSATAVHVRGRRFLDIGGSPQGSCAAAAGRLVSSGTATAATVLHAI